MKMRNSIPSCLAACAVSVLGKCYEPSPAFPVPSWTNLAAELSPTFDIIQERIQEIIRESKYDNTSYSVEVTSSTETLWGSWHTARNQNETRPGTRHVDGSSQYRIASITKVFTTLAILYQQKAGNVSLDAPVSQYISALNSPEYQLPWKDITLRALASQLSGIPREFAQGDILNLISDPTTLGLPPVSRDNLPACDEYNNYKPCNASDLLSTLTNFSPLFAPNQKSTYSNINFELLGLVLQNVSGVPYKDYITHTIFQPLNMTSSSLTTPSSDTHAVLPLVPPETLYSGGSNYWDVDEGIQNPTGGIYSSSTDMSTFVRYVLTHYNALATGINFLMPQSYGTGINNFYGLPFEIFRTDRLLPSTRRPVTFATKSGGLPGYYSLISILEEYALGFTVLVGGDASLVRKIQSLLAETLLPAAEEVIWNSIDRTYTGQYLPLPPSSELNSSLSLTTSYAKGLQLSHFTSNATDVLRALGREIGAEAGNPWHAQLIPTLLFEDEENQQGEIWRVVAVNERTDDPDAGVWDDHCVTDVDVLRYAGQPVTKVVFWHEKGIVELPAFELTLRRAPEEDEDEELTIQKMDL